MTGTPQPALGRRILASLLAVLTACPLPAAAAGPAAVPVQINPGPPQAEAGSSAELEEQQPATRGDAQREPTKQPMEPRRQGQESAATPEKEGKAPEKKRTTESPFVRLLASDLSPAVSDVALDVQPFGYNLFQGEGGGPQPSDHAVVGADYVLGPNDEFTVTVWGQVDGVYKVRINRDGEAVFPRIGAVPVAGLSYGEVKTVLARIFSQQFKNVSISVAIGQLRSIQVFVVGEVQKPGRYMMSSLSTVLNALFAAGGPTTSGTLRNIKLLRNGKVETQIDLYEFLLKGDKSQDVRLQDQDTIFVPLVGPVVGVAGHVQRPAVYEIKGEATLGDVLELAGGVRPTGYLARVQIERIMAHEKRIALDLNLAPVHDADKRDAAVFRTPSAMATGGHGGLRSPVQNMDMVKVFPINPLMQEVVYLKGHVVRPGPYELRPGMRVGDVIKGPGDLLPEAFLEYARIIRYTEPERARQVVPFNLQNVLAGDPSANLELKSLDEIEVYSKEELKAFPTVSIVGEVRKPGLYPLLKEMRVSDLVVVAGGFEKLAYQKQAELTRYTVEAGTTTMTTVLVDLERAMAGDPHHNLELQELDALAVRPIPESEVGRSVMVQGEVKMPGQYWIKRGERLSSVLKRAGGFTDKAFPPGLILMRESVKQIQQTEIQKFVAVQKQKLLAESAALTAGGLKPDQAETEQAALNAQLQFLDQLAARQAPGRVVVKCSSLEQLEGTTDDVLLEPGDHITVPQQPTTVTILGAVRNATSVVYREGMGLNDYILQAGGMTSEADKGEVYVVRADGSTESGWLKFKPIYAGDTIVVPHKIEPKTRPLPLWQAIATIIGSMMMSAAAIAVIGRR